MRAKSIMIPAVSAAVLLLSACASKQVSKAGVPPAFEPHAVSLNTAILPIFTRSCGVCHKREGGNDEAVANKSYFETREDILARVGKFIIPGKPGESGLIKVLDQTYPVGKDKVVMPPPGSDVAKWSSEELKLFSQWILEGAKDN